MRPKLLLLDEPCAKAKSILEEVFEFKYPDTSEYTTDFTCIYTQLNPVVTNAPVFCPCTGIDHIKTDNDIIYLDDNWKQNEGRLITSTAEHTWSLILQLAKMKRIQLSGKKIGIIGFGRIGKQIDIYSNAFNMIVLLNDIYKQSTHNLTELLKESDIITLHVPLNQSTQNLISKKEFDMMKDGALLVNTSRAEIVDNFALLQALESGQLGGYANDFDILSNHKNVIATPHIAGNCIEARQATDIYIAKRAIQYWKERSKNL